MEKGTDGAPVTDIVAENEQHEPGRTSEFNLTDGSSKSARMPVEGQPTPTEAELRRLYEEEEIERFLGLFADVSATVPLLTLLLNLSSVRIRGQTPKQE